MSNTPDTRYTAPARSLVCRDKRLMKRGVETLTILHGRKLTAAERGAVHFFGVPSRKDRE